MKVHTVEEKDQCLGFRGLFQTAEVKFEVFVGECSGLGIIFMVEDGLLPFDLFVEKDFLTIFGTVFQGDSL